MRRVRVDGKAPPLLFVRHDTAMVIVSIRKKESPRKVRCNVPIEGRLIERPIRVE